MTNTPSSPIESVNAAINSHNPFINAGIVKEQNIWGKGFPDVTTLNQHASNKIFEALESVRQTKHSQDKITSIAITAQQGVGKTHLLSRVRHQLEKEGGALFVYASANNYTDLNLVKYQFQQTLADSLSKTGSQGVMQWQEVAAAMVNENREITKPATELIKRFDNISQKKQGSNQNFMDSLQRTVMKNRPDADPYIIRAILWTLSETQAPFAIRWLSGEELSEANAYDLGLPNSNRTNQEREAEALKNIQQVLNLVSHYNSVVICFDEVDVRNNSTEDGYPTESVIANFVKILHDTLENSDLGKGVVIITVMLPETWRVKVNSLPGGTPDRISKFTRRKPIDLEPLNANSILDIVATWLKEYYTSKNLIPPHILYPFSESQLREYGKNKLTVREALQWCANNFCVQEEQLPQDPASRFELGFTREMATDIKDYSEDSDLIAEALYFGFTTLKGQVLEQVMIEEIIDDVQPKSKNKNFIRFKIVGHENGKLVKIGVAVVQDTVFTLTACLKRLNDYETFDLTRGCLVRSYSKIEQMKKKSEGYKLLNELISEKGGENVDLIDNQIRPLIAILHIYQKRENYQLTEQEIFDIIHQNKITSDNLLLREILSDPSGSMIEVSDEDIIEELFSNSDINETDKEDDLADLFS
ncbi:hypothetical protein B7O87_01355 [Cylindrospermopsis raciborskii CENA303]|uniref:KAP NTPase domain-containing protein n=1 Tax=Cylindrospermopsis raciborskii CENA303 TaxID=1170769 RepID=A0A1X4GJB0_9CYAN|nr:P-loop NTPase fold protein [Cylindrospermopsis raciborskii]OSO97150.1 hypothetical protein B7O87_01355 [Cylindrospermopsis raciborskii CENA303]